MNRPTENANRIYNYVKNHPGCNHAQIEAALNILNNEFNEARGILKNTIVSRQVKGSLSHGFYLAEVKVELPVS